VSRLTADMAKDMKHSTTWGAFNEELDARINIIYQTLHACKPEDLFRLQAKLQVYQEVKDILQAVIDREE